MLQAERCDGPAQRARHAAFAALKAELAAAAAAPPAAQMLIPTALPALDRLLGGGFPRGALVALEGDAGRWSIAARLAAEVTRRALIAIVDDGALYPPGLVRAGTRLDRVLIAPASTPLGIARAADILLRSRACRLVVVSAPNLRPAVWSRLATLAHRSGVLLLVIAERAAPALAGAAALRLECTLERLLLHGSRGLWCTLAGFDLRAHVRKHQRAGNATATSVRLRAVEAIDGLPAREAALPPALRAFVGTRMEHELHDQPVERRA